jgi:thiamine biosynthesis lipoprotein
MRFWWLSFFLLLLGCGREPLVQSQSYVFGTLVDISIYGESEAHAHEVSNIVFQDFQRLHQQYHAWQKGSELYALNEAFSQGKTIQVSPELREMLQEASALSMQSGGLFNPALGQLIRAWGFQRDEFIPIDIQPDDIKKMVNAKPTMADIVMTGDKVHSKNPAVQLDLGGYAKGYALDKAAEKLHQLGIKNALVNIGGNIIALGQHGDHPWRVGIQHPRQPQPIATVDLLDGWAIGTSGDYQRYFIAKDGKRYCHIIDPRTGYPVAHTQAVTVLIPPQYHAGVLSDVSSKPIFIAADYKRQSMASVMGVKNYLVVDAHGEISLSDAMKKRIHWLKLPKQERLSKNES